MKPGAGFAIGIGAGIAIGVALDNIAVGLAIGAAMGLLFANSKKLKKQSQQNNDQVSE